METIVAVAWPLAIVIITVAVIVIAFWFRPEVRSLLPRLRRAGPNGIEFDAGARQKAGGEAVVAAGELKQFPGLSRTPAIEQVERTLHDAIKKQIKSEDREDLLVRLLAQTRLELVFEQTYTNIFGSQIAGLKRLNERIRVSLDEAYLFFNDVKNTYPEVYSSYDFENWLGFLKIRDFVRQVDNIIEITDVGRDFLMYLVARHLPENKPW